MKLRLHRDKTCGKTAQLGKLYVDDKYFCETLEDIVREVAGQDVSLWKVPGHTAIPRCSYTLSITMSPRFRRELPLLHDVPGFTGVRIHSGNFASQSSGCILVGTVRNGESVGNSREAFGRLFSILDAARKRGEVITIEVA